MSACPTTRSITGSSFRPGAQRRLLTWALLGLLAVGLHATVVAVVSLPEMVDASALIVEGTVLEQVSGLDSRGAPTTRVVLQAGEVFKDIRRNPLPEAPGRIAFQFPGGESPGENGDLRLTIPGMPTLEIGERAVFLLTPRSARGFRFPVGLAQGVLLLHREDDGSLSVTRRLEGLTLAEAGRGGSARSSGGDGPAGIPADYETLAERLRELVRVGR